MIVEPEGGTTWRAHSSSARSCPSPPTRPKLLRCSSNSSRFPDHFGILRDRRAVALSVSDAETAQAVRFAWERHGLVVEPGGAVALAAVLAGKMPPLLDTVVILSGGNVDPALHTRIINHEL